MADEIKTSTVILRYSVDRNSLNQAQLASSRIRGDMQSVAAAAKQVDLATVRTGDSIRKSFGSSGSASIRALIGPSEDATKQMNRLKESVTGVQNEVKSLKSLKVDAFDLVPEIDTGARQGRSISETLKFIGREGRALPSQQIPGLGVGTDAVSKIISLFGALSPVALGTSVAIGGVAIALKILSDNAGKAKEAALADLDARQRALELLKAGNREEVQERIKALQEQRTNNEQAVKDANSVLNRLRIGIYESFGDIGLAVSEFNSTLGTGAGELSGAKEDLEKANQAFAETNTELLLLEQGVNGLGDAAAQTALELARANNAIALDNARISAQVEASNLAATGTEKQVQDRIDSLGREKAVLLANKPIMEANLAAAEAGSDAQKAYQTQLDNTKLRLAELDTTMMTLAGDTLQAAKANDAAAIAEKKRVDSIKAVEAYNTDVARINEQAAAKETDLAQKYADKQVEIAAKAVEDAEKLLSNLEQKLASLSTDVGRDLDKDTRKANFDALQAQIEFQREEVRETTRHYQDLERIRRQAQTAEFEQGLDRDFSGLARSRRQTAEQISEANIQFNQDRQARLDEYAAKRADDAAEFAFERQERIIKFEQDVSDARAQYARERQALADAKTKQLAQAKAAYDKEIALVQSKHRAELAARDSAIRAEIQMIQAGNNARIQLEQQLQNQIAAIIQGTLSALGNSISSSASAGVNLSGGSGGSTGNGAGNTGGLGGIFGFGASATQNSSKSSGLNMNMPITITTGGSAAQVQAIVPAIRKTVDEALTNYHHSIYGK